jgi:hypothetical protein
MDKLPGQQDKKTQKVYHENTPVEYQKQRHSAGRKDESMKSGAAFYGSPFPRSDGCAVFKEIADWDNR